MDQGKLNQVYKSWGFFGGLVGFITTVFLFGFSESPRDVISILIGGLKGFLGGGIGAGIFHGLAAVIFEPKFTKKIMYFTFVVLLTAVALFLAYKYSPEFNSLTNPEPKFNYILF